MKAWFLRFRVREQIALLAMAAAVFAYVLFMFFLLPLQSARSDLRTRNEATGEALARVDGLASEVRALRSKAAETASPSRRNLTARVNASAERFGLRPSRLQPNSRGAVQVRFEAATVEALLRWLHELESGQGLAVEELSMSQTSAAGIVSASARIAALP